MMELEFTRRVFVSWGRRLPCDYLRRALAARDGLLFEFPEHFMPPALSDAWARLGGCQTTVLLGLAVPEGCAAIVCTAGRVCAIVSGTSTMLLGASDAADVTSEDHSDVTSEDHYRVNGECAPRVFRLPKGIAFGATERWQLGLVAETSRSSTGALPPSWPADGPVVAWYGYVVEKL